MTTPTEIDQNGIPSDGNNSSTTETNSPQRNNSFYSTGQPTVEETTPLFLHEPEIHTNETPWTTENDPEMSLTEMNAPLLDMNAPPVDQEIALNDGIAPLLDMNAPPETFNGSNTSLLDMNATPHDPLNDSNTSLLDMNTPPETPLNDGNTPLLNMNAPPETAMNDSNTSLLDMNATPHDPLNDGNTPLLNMNAPPETAFNDSSTPLVDMNAPPTDPEIALSNVNTPLLKPRGELLATAAHSTSVNSDIPFAEACVVDDEHNVIHEDPVIHYLKDQGFPKGLADSLIQGNESISHRIWILDNSFSMEEEDGYRLVEFKNEGKHYYKSVGCQRWNELQECVLTHAEMAVHLSAPSTFRLLCDWDTNEVGEICFHVGTPTEKSYDEEIQKAKTFMDASKPCGMTPLTKMLRKLHSELPRYHEEGKKIVIVIATDGSPSDSYGRGKMWSDPDSDFVKALKALEVYNIWIVVRLCTDMDFVTYFYNEVDKLLEKSFEVLDDFVAEAKEVYEHNRWINYGLPLHRCREMGFHHRLFDLIDERPLHVDEMVEFCSLIFGENVVENMPDPARDWTGFSRAIKSHVAKENLQYNPVKQCMMPWIDAVELNKEYGIHRRVSHRISQALSVPSVCESAVYEDQQSSLGLPEDRQSSFVLATERPEPVKQGCRCSIS